MPETSYAISHAIAVGDMPALGNLKLTNSLCGHVLKLHCPDSPQEGVLAVVASSCNFGAGDCGVDLITKTWNEATGNKPPGITRCTVSMTDANAMSAAGEQCFVRPDAVSGSSERYTSCGMFNTGAKRVVSATLNGVSGTANGVSGYWDFSGSGFTGSAIFEVAFADGSTSSMAYSDCQTPASVHIWS